MSVSKYKSKAANEKHAKLLIGLSEKIVWAILAVPLTYLVKSDAGQFMQLDWISPYILVGSAFGVLAMFFQKAGFDILDEVSFKEELAAKDKNV
ncbi:MAG: hypothetical protein JJU30_13665 [Alkalimonas sp.]|nr:hypothetical protein [Alkalimonas sp.]